MQMITNVYKDNSVLVTFLIRWKRLIPLFKLGKNTFDSFHESAIYSFFDSFIENSGIDINIHMYMRARARACVRACVCDVAY